jgi:hypothetical protein
MQHETGLAEKALGWAIDTLSKGYLCRVDTPSEVVWVVNMLKYQGRGQKIVKSVTDQLLTLHACPLIPEFLEHYHTLSIPLRYPFDTPSIGVAPFPSPDPVPVLQEGGEGETPISATRANGRSRQLGDDEFLAALRSNPAYSHLELDRELAKMDAWLLAHPQRKKTRRFIVNWIGKVEKPVQVGSAPQRLCRHGLPPPRPGGGGCFKCRVEAQQERA